MPAQIEPRRNGLAAQSQSAAGSRGVTGQTERMIGSQCTNAAGRVGNLNGAELAPTGSRGTTGQNERMIGSQCTNAASQRGRPIGQRQWGRAGANRQQVMARAIRAGAELGPATAGRG